MCWFRGVWGRFLVGAPEDWATGGLIPAPFQLSALHHVHQDGFDDGVGVLGGVLVLVGVDVVPCCLYHLVLPYSPSSYRTVCPVFPIALEPCTVHGLDALRGGRRCSGVRGDRIGRSEPGAVRYYVVARYIHSSGGRRTHDPCCREGEGGDQETGALAAHSNTSLRVSEPSAYPQRRGPLSEVVSRLRTATSQQAFSNYRSRQCRLTHT
jgi:hypothetical protein